MGTAITPINRHCIVSLLNQNVSKVEISKLTSISYNSVLTICKRYKEMGKSGIVVNYHLCGRKRTDSMKRYQRICLWLKRLHRDWGAPFIRVLMTRRYGSDGLPSIREMQRWFRAAHLNKPRQRKGQPSIGKALAEHNIWQIDAKERFTLAKGQVANYLNVVNEHSGSWLEASLFPLSPHQSGTC